MIYVFLQYVYSTVQYVYSTVQYVPKIKVYKLKEGTWKQNCHEGIYFLISM